MSLRSHGGRSLIREDGLAAKLAIPIAALLLVPIWLQVLGSAMLELDRHLLDLRGVLLGWTTVFWALLYLIFLTAFVVLYVRLRSVDVHTGWPNRQSVPALAAAVVPPVALVALSAAVTTLGDSYFMIVSGSSLPWFAADPMLYAATVARVAVGVVLAVGLLHVILQSELRTWASSSVGVVATTGVGGVLFATQGLSVGVVAGGRGYPVWGEYIALLALVAAIGLAVWGIQRAQAEWHRYAAVTPLGVVAVGTVAQFLGIVDNGAFFGSPVELAVPDPATTLFAIAVFAMVGFAAAAYERSESILAPALVYAATYIAAAGAVAVVDLPIAV